MHEFKNLSELVFLKFFDSFDIKSVNNSNALLLKLKRIIRVLETPGHEGFASEFTFKCFLNINLENCKNKILFFQVNQHWFYHHIRGQDLQAPLQRTSTITPTKWPQHLGPNSLKIG